MSQDAFKASPATKREQLFDTVATTVIKLGGIATVIAVLTMLFQIAYVFLPLFLPADRDLKIEQPQPLKGKARVAHMGLGAYFAKGNYFEKAFVMDDGGKVYFLDLIRSGEIFSTKTIGKPAGATKIEDAVRIGEEHHAFRWDNGAVSVAIVGFSPEYDDEGERTGLFPVVREVQGIQGTETMKQYKKFLARRWEGSLTVLGRVDAHQIELTRITRSEDYFGEVTEEKSVSRLQLPEGSRITSMTANREASLVFAGTSDGYLYRWRVSTEGKARLVEKKKASDSGKAITALEAVIGDIAIATGFSDGSVNVWSLATVEGADSDDGRELFLIHELESIEGPVDRIVCSLRNRCLFILSDAGKLETQFTTSERKLFDFSLNETGKVKKLALTYSGKGLMLLNDKDELQIYLLKADHPEVSFKALFGKVWYEGHEKPKAIWQSSSASDDFESKLSLLPLIFGSVKGAMYAMLFSVPFALLAATYTSQFASPVTKKYIKPIVEIMAAIPSVIIGFLAAIWLAPIVNDHLMAFVLYLLLLPILFFIFMAVWKMLYSSEKIRRFQRGTEFLLIVPLILLVGVLAWLLQAPAEALFVSSANAVSGSEHETLIDFINSFFGSYDQRNCIIISFALGFAVIPIIFTISEDSLSNVPPSLVSASLALGASRWQTVWKVVLPSASPGIFAGMIIGFGRAVGETMIVLMATGNTDIISWNIFNGMRTLSANIAVEIPEAPVGGSLYRVLFLSAGLLLILISVLNTVAELIRQSLRKKYARF